MKVNASALRHGIDEAVILHAAATPVYLSEPDEDIPAKQVILGFDAHGRLLELAVLTFDSGNQLVIHAMKARRAYLNLLEETSRPFSVASDPTDDAAGAAGRAVRGRGAPPAPAP